MFKNFIRWTCLFVSLFAFLFIGKNFLQADGNNFSSSGNGSENDPYIVSTAEQFKNLADLTGNYDDKYFKLASDIDLNNYAFAGIKKVHHFNGNGHVIKNFTINGVFAREGGSLAGLFTPETPENETLSISNVGIENATINVTLNSNFPANFHVGILAGWLNSANNCFVQNSTLKINGNAYCSTYIGMFSGVVSDETVENCYVCNCSVDLSNFNKNDNVIHFGYFSAQSNGCNLKNCYSKAENNYASTVDNANLFCICLRGASITNCHYNEENMTGPDALTNMNLGSAFRTTESYPVLKAFDTKINSLSFADDNTSYEIYASTASAPLKVKLNLSNTLNQQNQADKIILYIDDNKITEITSGDEISIPANVLNDLSIGDHELQVKIFDWDSNALSICDQKLTLTAKEPPVPDVNVILLSPTSHSRSKSDQLTSFTATLTGKNFSTAYNITLRFKNKSTNQETDLNCGKFSGSNTNSQIINITGNNLNTIKNLPVGKYTVQAIITK